jgi:opacity protein-like surface antigen
MVNAWRDFEVSDRVSLYLGGGIGAGGYRVAFDGGFPIIDATISGNTSLTGFAWQAGTGASWLVTDRVALDLGYRWYAIDGGPARMTVNMRGLSFTESVGTNYGASELLFTIRVYDPFQRR